MEKNMKFKVAMGVLAGALAAGTAASTLVAMKILKTKKQTQSMEIAK